MYQEEVVPVTPQHANQLTSPPPVIGKGKGNKSSGISSDAGIDPKKLDFSRNVTNGSNDKDKKKKETRSTRA